jgi:DNA polymerase II large subunit
MRRDCDGDEACFILLMDAFLNFSRQFLPDNRGGRTMDSPLVLTSHLNPKEVDDMAHGVDVVWKYHLEFYEACQQYKSPSEVDIEQIRKRLGTEKQYEKMGYTHEVSSMNQGVRCSAYKTLPSMEDKLKGQMEIARKIRAVEQSDVAAAVIEKHFLKDIKGNLRKFSMQKFRCVKCNEKFRRPPLIGKCTKCGGKIIFTISEGSVIKYLEPSISLANRYNVSPYLKQSLELLKRRAEGVFGKDKEKQSGLGSWFG